MRFSGLIYKSPRAIVRISVCVFNGGLLKASRRANFFFIFVSRASNYRSFTSNIPFSLTLFFTPLPPHLTLFYFWDQFCHQKRGDHVVTLRGKVRRARGGRDSATKKTNTQKNKTSRTKQARKLGSLRPPEAAIMKSHVVSDLRGVYFCK